MKNKIALVSILAFLVLFTSSCSRVKNPSDKDVQKKLDALMMEAMANCKAPGMILAVWAPGKGEYVKAMGYSDVKNRIPMRTTDRFRMASNTKAVTATIFLQLVDEKKISLDDKLSKFFPKWPNAGKITMEMLLNHESGIFNFTDNPLFQKQFKANLKRHFTVDDILNFAVKEKPYFEPGKGYEYSNTNTFLLGSIIEKVTGHKLADEMNNRIIKPLGLAKTYFPESTETNGAISRGYYIEKGKLIDSTVQDMSWGWAAGGMITNITDMKKMITAITGGSLLSNKLQSERMNNWSEYSKKMGGNTIKTLKYGYNIFSFGGLVGHNGGIPGYISFMMRDPKTGVTTLMFMNVQPDDPNATLIVLYKVINIIFPGRKI